MVRNDTSLVVALALLFVGVIVFLGGNSNLSIRHYNKKQRRLFRSDILPRTTNSPWLQAQDINSSSSFNVSSNETSANHTCAGNSGCADLVGNCCPTDEGVVLGCCSKQSTDPPATVIEKVEVEEGNSTNTTEEPPSNEVDNVPPQLEPEPLIEVDAPTNEQEPTDPIEKEGNSANTTEEIPPNEVDNVPSQLDPESLIEVDAPTNEVAAAPTPEQEPTDPIEKVVAPNKTGTVDTIEAVNNIAAPPAQMKTDIEIGDTVWETPPAYNETEPLPSCVCMNEWIDPSCHQFGGGNITRHGCAAQPCGEWPDTIEWWPWCFVVDRNCKTHEDDEGGGWAFCIPDPPSTLTDQEIIGAYNESRSSGAVGREPSSMTLLLEAFVVAAVVVVQLVL